VVSPTLGGDNAPDRSGVENTATTPGRRRIRYEGLDAIMPDVERFLEGHRTVGDRSVAQIYRHVGSVLRDSVDLPASTRFDPAMRFDEEKRRAALESGVSRCQIVRIGARVALPMRCQREGRKT
jgi:hypothetical protein